MSRNIENIRAIFGINWFSLWNFGADPDRKLTVFNCEGFLLTESIHTAFSLFLVYAQKHLEYKISEINLEEQSFDLDQKLCLTEWYINKSCAVESVKPLSLGTVFWK